MTNVDGPTLSIEAILTERNLISVLRRDMAVTLVEISRSGCLLECSQAVDVGTLGMLHLELDGRPYGDPVRVAHCHAIPGAGDRFHVGAEFVWLDAPGDNSLRSFASTLPY